jgi:hypothetical protein
MENEEGSFPTSVVLRPYQNHIRILEARFLYAAKHREQVIEQNPYLNSQDLWLIDMDLEMKKRELDDAIDFQHKQNRKYPSFSFYFMR